MSYLLTHQYANTCHTLPFVANIRLYWRCLVDIIQSTRQSAEYKWESCQKKSILRFLLVLPAIFFFSASLGQWLCRRVEMMWLREISAWLLSAGCVKGKVTCRWAEAWRNFPAHGGNRTKWFLCHSEQIAPSIRKHMTCHTYTELEHTHTHAQCVCTYDIKPILALRLKLQWYPWHFMPHTFP